MAALRALSDVAVAHLITAAAYLRSRGDIRTVTLCGQGSTGLYVMLAAPNADAVIADAGTLDLTSDDALLADDYFVPGLRRLGDVKTTLTLAAPRPVYLYNVGAKLPAVSWVREVYTALNHLPHIRVDASAPADETLAVWAQNFK